MAPIVSSTKQRNDRTTLGGGIAASIGTRDLVDLEDSSVLHGSAKAREALDNLHDAEDAMNLDPGISALTEMVEHFHAKRAVFIECVLAEKLGGAPSSAGDGG